MANFYLGYSNTLATSFDNYVPILDGICERLKDSVSKMGDYLDNHPDDSDRSEVFIYLIEYRVLLAKIS